MNYLDVGGFPTDLTPYDFNSVKIRELQVGELPPITLAHQTENLGLLIDVINGCCDVDISKLSEGDFVYLLAFIRSQSFPETPRVVTWRCNNSIFVDREGKYVDKADYRKESCGRLNTDNVHNSSVSVQRVSIPENDFFSIPSIKLLDELSELSKEVSGFARDLLWFKQGETLVEKMEIFKQTYPGTDAFERLAELRKVAKTYTHGLTDVLPVRCARCGHSPTIRHPATPLSILPRVSKQTLHTIKYNLLTQFNTYIPDSTSAMEFLYINSSLEKDKRELKERQDALGASKGSMRTVQVAR